ncbi:helix-turn-helix domain-containing protein [Paenibacillus sp. P26]|nr:helix-turn-helix domain-containing protein [Paenibacillus sp. P26]UUZ89834.1 helix-turn-helix domain-containing protein [Paenibacillus sp. P25]
MDLEFSPRQIFRIIRTHKKIKLKDIANAVGVSIQMISMYENERTNLHMEKEKIYRAYIRNSVKKGGTSFEQAN